MKVEKTIHANGNVEMVPRNFRLFHNVRFSQGETVPNRASYRLAWVLAILSTLTLEIAIANGEQSFWVIVTIVSSELAIAGLLSLLVQRVDFSIALTTQQNRDFSRPHSGNAAQRTSRLIAILCLATAPFIAEIVVRGVTNTMLPLELLLLSYFRDGVLALAAFAHREDCQRTCCSLSTFLIIFSSALSSQLVSNLLVVAFTIVGIWWLMGTYWESLSGRLAATSAKEQSRKWLVALPLVVLSVLLLLPAAATQTHVLRGFMPSSGGSEWYSEKARSGVGDGDALVAGTENIQSFAPIEEAPFQSSHEPSLYDLFDDNYSEPQKIEKQERAIGLLPQTGVKPNESQLAESKQAGREFATVRKPASPKSKQVTNRDSNALLYVKGRVPLHLKVETFDQYDGIEWFPEPLSGANPTFAVETLHEKPWLRIKSPEHFEIYGPPENHALKIIRLNTNRIPSPTQLLGVHLDKVDRLDFFAWSQPGIIRLEREQIPSLTVIHVQSRVIDERLIRLSSSYLAGGTPAYRQYGDDAQSLRVRQLAREWTEGVASGWPQVQAIVEQLRHHYLHSSEAVVPADCNHTVAHFLFESRRGPDYQFASAAVWMLRSLGFSARLVSGFYADPSRYEPRAAHTAVTPHDVHFWAEVCAGADNWLPVEPTPGYELLKPPLTTVERLFAMLCAAARFLNSYRYILSPCVCLCVVLFLYRCWVADRIATAIWRWRSVDKQRDFVRQTLRLLDQRCQRAGLIRSESTTPCRWLQRLSNLTGFDVGEPVQNFIELADWAQYAPMSQAAPSQNVCETCRHTEAILSWKRLQELIVSGGGSSRADRVRVPLFSLIPVYLSSRKKIG